MNRLHEFYTAKVADFLKTVVCFDDKAEYGSAGIQKQFASKSEDGFSDESSSSLPTMSITEEYAANNEIFGLNAKALTHAFAEKAILCSVIKPDGASEHIAKQIVSLGKAADVLILDWKLAERDSTIARDALLKIIADDERGGGRLRLVVVYSIEKGKDVIEELFNLLQERGYTREGESLEIKNKHSLIVFYQKPGTVIPFSEIIDYDKLPDEIIKSFTSLTAGLLPAATLSAITAIREQTHHLLATFPSTLDGAFLTHRCLIPDPSDSEQFLLDLLEGEIGAMLRHSSVSEAVNSVQCRAWVAINTGFSTEGRKVALTAIQEYKRNNKTKGFQKLFASKDEKDVADKVLELFYKLNPEDLKSAKEELSILATLDTHRKRSVSPPVKALRLQLGVVVKDHSQSRYLLCIQPLCDSLRIKPDEQREFPFLRLEQFDFSSDQGSLELCIPHNDDPLWLTVKTFPKNIVTFPFKAKSATEAFVGAELDNGAYFFPTGNGIKLEWLAELKIGKAQRIVSQLAARIHTLGIDEFEWMRLHQ